MISLCVFIIFDFSINKVNEIYRQFKNNQINESQEINEIENKEILKQSNPKEKKSEVTKEKEQEEIWQVEIPKTNLVAPISEGTSQEIMMEFVGHFDNTSIWKGNVGLAAHNRGYPINYFSKLKELKKGDKVIYKTKYGTKTYQIKTIAIIEDTDWSYLQETKDNRITLITCVENKPNQRLCVQGTEIKEE